VNLQLLISQHCSIQWRGAQTNSYFLRFSHSCPAWTTWLWFKQNT